MRFSLDLLIYILINGIKNYNTIQFAVKLDKCVGSCNSLNDLSNRVCVPNKTEDLNKHVLSMIAGKK